MKDEQTRNSGTRVEILWREHADFNQDNALFNRVFDKRKCNELYFFGMSCTSVFMRAI